MQPLSPFVCGYDALLYSLLARLWFRGIVDPTNDEVLLSGRKQFKSLHRTFGIERINEIVGDQYVCPIENGDPHANAIAHFGIRLLTNFSFDAHIVLAISNRKQAYLEGL